MRKPHFFWMLALLSLPFVAQAEDKKKDAPAVSTASFKTFKEAYAAGNQALKDRKFQEAVADYAAAEGLATSAKGKGDAANAQGWAYLKAKKWQEAKKALEHAVEINSENKVALKNLGVACFRLYEYGFADVDELKDAVKNLEASGENQELLERAKGALGREEAYAQVTPVVESTSGMNFKALLALGDKLQSEGRFDEALKAFKEADAVAKAPAAKGAAANRQGKVLLDSRKPTESIAFFEQAVKAQPTEKVFQNNLGFGYWVLYDSGKGKAEDLKKAVDAFYKANSIDASYHGDNLKMALDELKEVDPEAAKAYTAKEDEGASEGTKADKDGGDKEDSK